MSEALTRAEVLEGRRRDRPAFIPESKSGAGRLGRHIQLAGRPRAAVVTFPPRKEDAPCCRRHALPDGRPVLGFCSPECLRRPGNWALHVAGKPIPPGGVPTRHRAPG